MDALAEHRDTGGCNICNPALRAAISEGRNARSQLDGKTCGRCGAPGRHRALARMLDVAGIPLLRELGLLGAARAICAAPGHHERRLVEPLTASLLTFSLFGKYSEGHITCDIRDLSRFESGSFDLFEASLVFDYVPEVELAIKNVARVLATPSVFFIYIQDRRLLRGSGAPRIARIRTRKDGLPEYYAEDFERQQIVLGRKWFANAWRACGFQVLQEIWQEPASGESFTWWVGSRTDRPIQQQSRGFALLRSLMRKLRRPPRPSGPGSNTRTART